MTLCPADKSTLHDDHTHFDHSDAQLCQIDEMAKSERESRRPAWPEESGLSIELPSPRTIPHSTSDVSDFHYVFVRHCQTARVQLRSRPGYTPRCLKAGFTASTRGTCRHHVCPCLANRHPRALWSTGFEKLHK